MVTGDFIEKLTALAMEGRKCEIVYLKNGGRVVLNERVASVYERDGVWYLWVMGSIEIPVDKLIRIDGESAQNFC